MRALGEQVRAHRQASHLTQAQVAKKASISAKYLSEIERGTRDLPISTLLAVVEHGLGLRLDIEFRAKNGSRPKIQLPPLPHAVDQAARNLAALPADKRNRVLALLAGITELIA